MKTFVIEHIPRDQEESELQQAGDTTDELVWNLSVLMLVGNRILTIYKEGQLMDANEAFPFFLMAARYIAVERLGTSLGMKLDEAIKVFGSEFNPQNSEEPSQPE